MATHTGFGWAVMDTIHRFFQSLDDGKFGEAASLFAQDGYWIRLGQRLNGPDDVEAALEKRPKGLMTRHTATTMVVDAAEDGAARARYYLVVYDHAGGETGPAPLDGPGAIFVCDDELIETPDGWRFRSRTPRLVFKRTA